MNYMSTLIENGVNNSTDSQEWENNSLKMRNSRAWLTQQACLRIDEMCQSNLQKLEEKNVELPDEVEFNWYNVRGDLMKFTNYVKDGKYNQENDAMEYSFDTIYHGGFVSPNGRVDRKRLREGGVVNPFVLDVKRAMADKCIKVWDVSDKKVSNKNVWKITIFLHEIRKLKEKAVAVEE